MWQRCWNDDGSVRNMCVRRFGESGSARVPAMGQCTGIGMVDIEGDDGFQEVLVRE